MRQKIYENKVAEPWGITLKPKSSRFPEAGTSRPNERLHIIVSLSSFKSVAASLLLLKVYDSPWFRFFGGHGTFGTFGLSSLSWQNNEVEGQLDFVW